MEYSQLIEEQKAAPEEKKGLYRSVVAGTCLGASVQAQFAGKLEAADSIDDFIESIFADRAMTTERVWSYIARTRENAEWASVLEPDAVTVLAEPRNGATLLEPADEETEAVNLPIGEVSRAYLFHDGSFNREITRFVGTVNGRYQCGDLLLDGRYDVHERNGDVFFEKWAYTDFGAREGEIEHRIACAACGGKH